MKNKSNYIKRVYKKVPFKGGYWFDPDHSLGMDFYPVNVVATNSVGSFKIDYNDLSLNLHVVAWRDKHGNVIVRFMSQYKQSKINF